MSTLARWWIYRNHLALVCVEDNVDYNANSSTFAFQWIQLYLPCVSDAWCDYDWMISTAMVSSVNTSADTIRLLKIM